MAALASVSSSSLRDRIKEKGVGGRLALEDKIRLLSYCVSDGETTETLRLEKK